MQFLKDKFTQKSADIWLSTKHFLASKILVIFRVLTPCLNAYPNMIHDLKNCIWNLFASKNESQQVKERRGEERRGEERRGEERRGQVFITKHFSLLVFCHRGAKASPRGAITFHSHDNGQRYFLKPATYFQLLGQAWREWAQKHHQDSLWICIKPKIFWFAMFCVNLFLSIKQDN